MFGSNNRTSLPLLKHIVIVFVVIVIVATINVVTAVPGTKAKAATMDPKPSVVEASTMVKVKDLVHRDLCLTQLIFFQF